MLIILKAPTLLDHPTSRGAKQKPPGQVIPFCGQLLSWCACADAVLFARCALSSGYGCCVPVPRLSSSGRLAGDFADSHVQQHLVRLVSCQRRGTPADYLMPQYTQTTESLSVDDSVAAYERIIQRTNTVLAKTIIIGGTERKKTHSCLGL